MPERILIAAQQNVPALFGLGTSVAAATIDMNWGAIAAGITTVGIAVAAAIAQIQANRTKAYKEAKAAEVDAYRQLEMAKIEVQRAANEAAKTSFSEQISDLQASVNEANQRLAETKALAAQQAELLKLSTAQNSYLSQQLSTAQSQISTAQTQIQANTQTLADVAKKQDQSLS